jgi:serine/threonine-protein kinase
MTQSWRPPTIVVGVLIALAAITAVVLASTLLRPDDGSSPDTVAPTAATAPVGDAGADGPEPAVVPIPDDGSTNDEAVGGLAQITSVDAFDPDGDLGENDELAVAAIADGDPTTTWRTSCYSNQFMGAKRGVGLVVSFDRPLAQGITLDIGPGPYQAQFYEWDGDTPPTSIDAWGEPFGRSFGPDAATVTVDSSGFAARHLLILLNEIGPDDACSTDNPFRGSIDEITVIG